MKPTLTQLLTLCLAGALVAPAWANAGPQGLKQGMPFSTARKLLLKQQWQPVNVHTSDNYAYMELEATLHKKGITELDSCAMDRPVCLFNYQKDGLCLQLITRGEQPQQLKVDKWTNTCPDNAAAEPKAP